jgi:lysozyme family protein
MSIFDRAVALIIEKEGGYVNDPRDPGGETKFGISRRAYPALDIANLTVEQAASVYRRDYWDTCQCDGLPPDVAVLVFDCAVNQGVGAAKLLLQESAGVKADGVVGPATLAAARKPDVAREFAALRAWRYEINRNEEVFGKGWFRRLFHVYDLATKGV